MTTAKIEIAFQSFWFVGTGREAGVYADSIPVKRTLVSESGIPVPVPCVPGKTVKGMFRAAFQTAGGNGWFGTKKEAEELEHRLFGQPGPDKLSEQSPGQPGPDRPAEQSPGKSGNPGILHFSMLEISPALKTYLRKEPDAAGELFRTVKSTAIDPDTGTAKNKSLREYEVVVPLTLTGEISFCEDGIRDPELPGARELTEKLNQVAALITELGGRRTRGLGQCVITVREEPRK